MKYLNNVTKDCVGKIAKEAFVKEQANRWNGKIDVRAYNALMNYEVNIDD